ncbi:membrane anchor subunit of succinate dehydrogenase, Sdh4 [Entomophthora muscae]|uniref:Membrane anchor subunit of succinate dehydrogenase, Sdh4 n=1 Tax=Entomophthora muscae TaxID=34485 RepID=A0ACC2U8X4_9FUNG|nr:membrane anchor subunit of succinate dehydrogenase, Sdh4 [Entomophthora muscae]
MSQVLTQALRTNGLASLRKSTFSPLMSSPSIVRLANQNSRLSSTKAEATLRSDSVPNHPVNRWEGSWHWLVERGLSISLIPMFGVSMLYGGHPTNDFLLGFVLPIHTHIGLSAVVTDYLPHRRLPIINRVVTALQFLLTGGAIYGCYTINTEDVGLTEYFKKMWKA